MLGFSRETEPTEYIEICKRGFIIRIGSRPLEDEKSYSPQARGQGRLTAQLCLSPPAFEDGEGLMASPHPCWKAQEPISSVSKGRER